MVAVDKVAQKFWRIELENIQSCLERDLRVCSLSAFRYLYPDSFQDGVQEGSEVLRKRVLLFKGEGFPVVAFFDGIVEAEDVLDIGVLEVFDLDGLEFGVELLTFIAGEEEEEVDGSDHRVVLGLVRDQGVLVEELGVIDGVFDAFVVPGGQSVEEIEFREPD